MISPDNSILLIIDIQEKFRPVLFNSDELISNVTKLVKAFQLLKIPILVSEQYPTGLGETVKEIKQELNEYAYVEKVSFDCFKNSDFLNILENKLSGKKHLIVCGIESHVCVIQTVLSAIFKGYNVHLIADAVSSRKKSDYDLALRRMENEGAKLSSSEMIIFQMIEDSTDKHFKEISRIVK